MSYMVERRVSFTFRLSRAALDTVKVLAVTETDGDASKMMRKLLSEAVAARQKRS
jgi:hypothetical protein